MNLRLDMSKMTIFGFLIKQFEDDGGMVIKWFSIINSFGIKNGVCKDTILVTSLVN
jgi:hypothetical protein